MVTEDAERDMPIESLYQTCECGHEIAVSIIHYPDGSYVVAGPPIDSDTCEECECEASFRMNDIRNQVTEAYCLDHGHDIVSTAQADAMDEWFGDD